MSRTQRAIGGTVTLFLALAFLPASVFGMGQERFGPAGRDMGTSPDLPKGVAELMAHPSGVYWNWVNGNEHAYYDGDVDAVNDLVAAFARIDLTRHDLVLRAGRPDARSFHGKAVPYTVDFHVPAGLFFHHTREYAATGLYPMLPYLTVHVDDELIDHLGDLKFPANVTLRRQLHRPEDALAQIGAHDRMLRLSAIRILGETGGASVAATDALEQASEDADEHIVRAAKTALTTIKHANVPDARAPRERVAGFVEAHPQAYRPPTAEELLNALKRTDGEYWRGFTATGTMVKPTLSGRTQLFEWVLTTGGDRLVLRQRAVDAPGETASAGRHETITFIGPEYMAQIHRDRIWHDGQIKDTKPTVSYEKPGRTYDLLVGRIQWPMGRGFGHSLERITEVSANPDGTLNVVADGPMGTVTARWTMRVDPDADHLVREAKWYRTDRAKPEFVTRNVGLLSAAGRSVAHVAESRRGEWADPTSISITSVSDKADVKLIDETAEWIENAEEHGASVIGQRDIGKRRPGSTDSPRKDP